MQQIRNWYKFVVFLTKEYDMKKELKEKEISCGVDNYLPASLKICHQRQRKETLIQDDRTCSCKVSRFKVQNKEQTA